MSKLYLPIALLQGITYRLRSQPVNLDVVFVVGAPRSGTTLVQTVLARHPDYAAIDAETGFFRPDFFYRSRRWRGERAEILENCSGRSLTELFSSFALAVTKHDARLTFVEKSPHHIKSISWILRNFPNAKIVHILRDPRDGLVSAANYQKLKHNETESYARYWDQCVRARLSAGRQDRVFDLEYEYLASAPQQALVDLMSFLGKAVHPDQLDPEAGKPDKRSARKEFQRIAQPVSPASVGRYRTALSNDQKRTVRTGDRCHIPPGKRTSGCHSLTLW